MVFKSLENISTQALMDAFNKSFEGYEIPLRFELDAFERKLKVENYLPKYSVGAFNEHNELVGFIIHCDKIDQSNKTLYNSGTGVIPEYRGKSITKAMYQYAIQKFESENIKEVILEVLVNNKPAYKSYLDSGFEKSRNFLSYKGSIKNLIVNHHIKKDALTEAILKDLESFYTIKPSWQNDSQSVMLSIDFVEFYGAYENKMLIGGLIYNPLTKRIHQIVVHPDHRNKGVGSSLMAALYQDYPDTYTIINIDSGYEAVHLFFTKIGFENLVELDELTLKLRTI